MIGLPDIIADRDVAAGRDTRRVYAIDDNGEVRRSLHFLLATSGITCWPFVGGQDFLDTLPSLRPAPILLDLRLRDIDGMEILAELQRRHVTWPVIVMSAHGDIRTVVRAMKLGAIDFLEKPFEDDTLKAAVAVAHDILDKAAGRGEVTDARHRLKLLTPREREIVDALCGGAANKQVAFQLGLSTRTVEMYRASALAKLQTRSIAQVAVLLGMVA